ncbi:right-handed parallel beta-helix repeat-containing protein, partial [bacterium]|nr:right-handed parallel beta-helix repeat-containing protein [bacterium]
LIGFHFIFYKIMSPEAQVHFLRSRPALVKILPVIRTVRKISDILYLHYFFQKSDLPIYELEIKENNIKKIDNSLPEGFTEEIYTNKIYVPAKFLANRNEYKVKVRYRGDNSIHWEADKKSYLVKFDSENLLNGVKRLSFIIPDDRKFVVEHLNNYRADKLGLIYPESSFGVLKINGKNYGLYFLIENWSGEMLAKWNVPDISNFYGGTDPDVWFGGFVVDQIWDNLGMWEKLQEDDKFNFDHFSEISKLMDLVNNSNEDEFNNLIFSLVDEDNFYSWNVHQVLVNSAHQGGPNLRIYFNNANGKFYFIPWDVDNFPPIEKIDIFYNKLILRILLNSEFMYERNKRLWDYVGNKENFKDDLNFYDKTYDNIKIALYKDRTKIYTNRWADNLMKNRRQMFIDEFNTLKNSLKKSRATVEVLVGKDISKNKEVLAIFNIKVDNLSEVFLDDFKIEFLENKLDLENYELFYDVNDNKILDKEDKVVNNNYKPFLYTKRTAPEMWGQYELNLTNHKFYLLSNKISQEDLIKNLSDFKFDFSNAITGKNLKKDDIKIRIINKDVFANFEDINNIDKFVFEHSYFNINREIHEISLEKGVYNIDKTTIIPKGYKFIIKPGVILNFKENISLVSYSSVIAEGSNENQIIFTAQDKNKGWGNFLILNNKEKNIFKNCVFEYGNESYINGVYSSGMLALHYIGDVLIENSVFKYAFGDDALNVKGGKAKILNNNFVQNKFDAIDLDWADKSVIENNKFLKNGNDSVDIGGGKDIIIKNNLVKESGDKCVSIGENAQNIIIFNNILTGCEMGIAIKDKSKAKIINNTLIDNKLGISIYQKKPVWGGAEAEVYNSIIWGVGDSISLDEKSKIKIELSNIKNGYEGENNFNIEPKFDSEYRLMNTERGFLKGGNKKYLKENDINIKNNSIPFGKIF